MRRTEREFLMFNFKKKHLDEDERILTETWNSFESVYSHDYYKYRRTMEEDANNKDLVNSVIYDYEKLLREECDCTKRIIPGMTDVKSFTYDLIPNLYICLCDLMIKFS